MTMKSANNTDSFTLGLIPNVAFNFGDINVKLQVQVVPNEAPFDVLLGRPFFSLTSCRSQDFPSGDQHITLTCPNTNAEVTLPTHPKTEWKADKGKEKATVEDEGVEEDF